MVDVLCFGNLQLDILCRTITELPPPGGLRMIDAVDFSLSGNGGSLAMALARLGVSVDLAGHSGADVIGDQFRSMLSTEGVGIDKLIRHPTAGTGTSVIALAPTGERSIFFVNGANEAFHLEDVPESWLQGLRMVAVMSVFVLYWRGHCSFVSTITYPGRADSIEHLLGSRSTWTQLFSASTGPERLLRTQL
jgi:sugar/nucleoside kinase (ribokinase family)